MVRLINKITLIGRLARDIELKFTPGNGTAVATGTLAVDRRYVKDGKKEVDFIPVVIWGKQAESAANYTSKGKLIGISGRIQVRNYVAKDGTKRYITEVIAEEVQFLEWNDKKESSNNNTLNDNSGFQTHDDITPMDDGETPF